MSGNMSVSSSGTATIEADCGADALTVDKVKVTCELQRLDGSRETIKAVQERLALVMISTSGAVRFSRSSSVNAGTVRK